MKKLFKFGVIALAFTIALVATGCSKNKSKVLKIGATPVPHAELLNFIKGDLSAKGVDIVITEFTDYVTPNTALVSGDIDANFFQHIPYLESNKEWTDKLVSAFGVHIEPFGLYSRKHKDIQSLPNGATISIPNDPSNGGRALLLLQASGLIKLKPAAGLEATEIDIAENPKNFRFRALEAAQLPRSLPDVDASTINGNYALDAGLNPTKDSLIIEGSQSPYVNIVVVRKGTENDPRIAALKQALLSDKVRKFISDTWKDGSVVPIF